MTAFIEVSTLRNQSPKLINIDEIKGVGEDQGYAIINLKGDNVCVLECFQSFQQVKDLIRDALKRSK